MSHYADIKLRPDPEFPTHQLMSALFGKLHRALVSLRADQLAASFPEYSEAPTSLGTILRVIGPPTELDRLMAAEWLQGMRDHVALRAPASVPAGAEQRHLRRVQAKNSPERLRRRQIRRHGLTSAQAQERIPDSSAERLELPFVQLRSASTGQTFRIYVRLGPSLPNAVPGSFNAYGLSVDASIPWF